MNRRRFLQANGGLLGSSLLAGCTFGDIRRFFSRETPEPTEHIDTIFYDAGDESHYIPLEEVHEVDGPNCDETHYHALDGTSVMTALCEEIADPGGCGFGKVSETPIEKTWVFDYPCTESESE